MKRNEKPPETSKNGSQVALFKGIDLKSHKTVRIAVSGDVPLNKLETAIVDTVDFQRLRTIKQLGTTYLVYPTAVHTRFDHSLGTLSTSLRMIRAIRENRHNSEEENRISDEQEQLIRLAALLHDIGHIPFGHTLEDEFCILPRHDKDDTRTERFIGTDSKIGRTIVDHLGKDLYDRFMRIYKVRKEDFESLGEDLFIYDLVNNTVCADLLDYLKRDCYFCNMSLDMDYRFLKYLYLRKDGNVRRVVVRLWKEGKFTPRQDILTELIRLLDNRYLIGERAYFHHAKLVAGAMVAGAVKRAMDARKIKKEELYEMGDETMLDRLQNSGVGSVKKLISGIRERKLWKKIYERSRQTVLTEQAKVRNVRVLDTIMKNWWEDANNRTADEERVVQTLGMDSADFLIHCPDQRMAMKLADMKVFWDGELRSLRECTSDSIISDKLNVILRSHENLWAIRVFINPDQSAKEAEVKHACRHMFTFDEDKKFREGKAYYTHVVQDIVEKNDLASGMIHDQYRQRSATAVERLLSQTAATRNIDEIKSIVENAFKS